MIEKTQTLHFKRAPSTEGEFEAYASTFGNVDVVGDIIVKGAFADALAAHHREGTKPALLWHHDQREPIGTWSSLVEDDHGLLVTGKLTLGTKRGREAYELMRDGAVSLSIGFSIASGGSRERNGLREITKIARLAEISVVAIPANTAARVISVKERPANPREFERLLRDVGFSNRESKALTSAGWRGIARDERNPLDLVLDRIESLSAQIEDIKNGR